MTKNELTKLEKVARQFYKKGQTFREIASILDLSLTDVIYLLLADQESKQRQFYGRKSEFLNNLKV